MAECPLGLRLLPSPAQIEASCACRLAHTQKKRKPPRSPEPLSATRHPRGDRLSTEGSLAKCSRRHRVGAHAGPGTVQELALHAARSGQALGSWKELRLDASMAAGPLRAGAAQRAATASRNAAWCK